MTSQKLTTATPQQTSIALPLGCANLLNLSVKTTDLRTYSTRLAVTLVASVQRPAESAFVHFQLPDPLSITVGLAMPFVTLAFIMFICSLFRFAGFNAIQHVALSFSQSARWWRFVFNFLRLAAAGGTIRIGENNITTRFYAPGGKTIAVAMV